MENPNIKPHEIAVPIQLSIFPGNYAAGAVWTSWIPMGTAFGAVMALLQLGVLGTAATVDAKLEQAQDSGGTGVKDITGKAITQLTQAGGDDEKAAIINCRGDELDVDNSFNHVRLTVTVAVEAVDLSAAVFGFFARNAPEAGDLAVDEIVG